MNIPAPEIIDPASVPSLKWGVIGPGGIANTFVAAVNKHTKQQIAAVASKTAGRADKFASDHNIARVHASYEDLVADDSLDAIYIASWQVAHYEHAMLALNAGKHVLIEKPIALLPEHATEIFALAEQKGLLAMEAMWTRYLPQSTVIRKLIEAGDLGAPQLFTGTFAADNRHIERLWTKGGGGIVYDMGIYPIAMAQQFMGNPSSIAASGSVDENLMDQESFAVMDYDHGGRSIVTTSGIATVPTVASCSYENGVVVIDEPFFVPSGIKLRDKELYFSEVSWADDSPIRGHEGLSYQATWFAHYVEQGRSDSAVHTAADTIANIAVAHEITEQLGAKPF